MIFFLLSKGAPFNILGRRFLVVLGQIEMFK